jgi:hypothetical protein
VRDTRGQWKGNGGHNAEILGIRDFTGRGYEDRSISIFVWRLGSVGDRPGFGVH